MEWIDEKNIYTIIHFFGVAFGAGGAFMSDFMFLASSKDRVLDSGELRMLRTGSRVTWAGLILLIISGALLFSLHPEGYAASSKFITKMIIVLILTINGIIFHIVHLPRMRKLVGKKMTTSVLFKKHSRGMYMSGAISVVSWTFALVLGGLRMIPISVSLALMIYTAVVIMALLAAELQRKKFLK